MQIVYILFLGGFLIEIEEYDLYYSCGFPLQLTLRLNVRSMRCAIPR